MPVLGQGTCQSIGPPCPSGDFPDDLPPDKPIFYVRDGAQGGTGSKELPWGTLGEALASVPEGSLVLVGKGTYSGNFGIDKGVSLRGNCPTQTLLHGKEGDSPVFLVKGGGVLALAGLKLSGEGPALRVQEGGSVTATGLWIHQARGAGIQATGGKIKLEDTLLSETRASADGKGGYGIVLEAKAELQALRVAIERNRTTGVLVSTSALSMKDGLIRDTQSQESDKSRGRGLQGQYGATISVERILLERNRNVGVILFDAGSSFEMSDGIIRDTRSQESSNSFGAGLEIQEGAYASVQRALFEGNRSVGVLVNKKGTKARLTDIVVQSTKSTENDGTEGKGLGCQEGAEAIVERALFDDNRDTGILVSNPDSTLTMVDVLIRNTRGRQSDQTLGLGLVCSDGAVATLRRVSSERNRASGMLASGKKTQFSLIDGLIEETWSQESDLYLGHGLDIENGAQAQIERAWLRNNRDVGILVSEKTSSLQMRDVIVQGTQSRENDLIAGRGLSVERGATVEARRSQFSGNREAGVSVLDSETSFSMTDGIILGTQSREKENQYDLGLLCKRGSTCAVARVLFERNREISIVATEENTNLEITDAVIRNTESSEKTQDFGRGLQVNLGARATVDRIWLDNNREIGVFVADAGTTFTAANLVLQRTQSRKHDGRFGGGLACQQQAEVILRRALLDGNRDRGLFASNKGTKISMSDVTIQNTQPQENDGEYGVGAALILGADLGAERSVFRSNRVASILLLQSSMANLSSCWLKSTLAGSFTPVGADGAFLPNPVNGVGDGLVMLQGSSVVVRDLLASEMSRAGLLFVDSSGQLRETSAEGGRYGMVLRGASRPSYDETCSFEENETPILPDGDLPVPNAPLPVPPPVNVP